MNTAYRADIDQLLARQHDNGADAFMTPDGKLLKGGPFTALESAGYLLELGVPPEHPVLAAVAERIFAWIRPDGRIRTAQTGAIYPCQTALALLTLCRMGFADDERLAGTFAYFLDTQQPDGGWKCNKYSFGRGPETEYSTPYTTLLVLDAFRYRPQSAQAAEKLSHAVNFLLAHWEIRTPISPCHYGIGSRFLQVEYPFRGYNLFYYVYVLSFYASAREDARFLAALAELEKKTVDGQIVVERVAPRLASLAFCRKGQRSELGTRRYEEIMQNMRGK